MTPRGRLLEAAHVAILGFSSGMTLLVGAMAGITFATLRRLGTTIEGYKGFAADHWSIAAGKIMNVAFLVEHVAALVALVLALATFVGASACRERVPHRVQTIRGIVLGMLLALVGATWFWIWPTMQADLTAYWNAAAAGDVETAAVHKRAFDDLHPTASVLLGMRLCLSLGAIVLACAALGRAAPAEARPA